MIIAVDFDGTLAVTDFPEIIRPITYVIEVCKRLKEMGHTLILNTCREGEYLDKAVEWCKSQGFEFDYVNENTRENIEKWGDCRKIYADRYIDNHNVLLPHLLGSAIGGLC